MTVRIRLDHRGMGAMLRSAEVAEVIAAEADKVQEVAEAHPSIVRHGMPVEHGAYATDRAAEGVTITHAGGVAVEAKHGVLADAARSVGLDVTADPPRDVKPKPRKRRRS